MSVNWTKVYKAVIDTYGILTKQDFFIFLVI